MYGYTALFNFSSGAELIRFVDRAKSNKSYVTDKLEDAAQIIARKSDSKLSKEDLKRKSFTLVHDAFVFNVRMLTPTSGTVRQLDKYRTEFLAILEGRAKSNGITEIPTALFGHQPH